MGYPTRPGAAPMRQKDLAQNISGNPGLEVVEGLRLWALGSQDRFDASPAFPASSSAAGREVRIQGDQSRGPGPGLTPTTTCRSGVPTQAPTPDAKQTRPLPPAATPRTPCSHLLSPQSIHLSGRAWAPVGGHHTTGLRAPPQSTATPSHGTAVPTAAQGCPGQSPVPRVPSGSQAPPTRDPRGQDGVRDVSSLKSVPGRLLLGGAGAPGWPSRASSSLRPRAPPARLGGAATVPAGSRPLRPLLGAHVPFLTCDPTRRGSRDLWGMGDAPPALTWPPRACRTTVPHPCPPARLQGPGPHSLGKPAHMHRHTFSHTRAHSHTSTHLHADTSWPQPRVCSRTPPCPRPEIPSPE